MLSPVIIFFIVLFFQENIAGGIDDNSIDLGNGWQMRVLEGAEKKAVLRRFGLDYEDDRSEDESSINQDYDGIKSDRSEDESSINHDYDGIKSDRYPVIHLNFPDTIETTDFSIEDQTERLEESHPVSETDVVSNTDNENKQIETNVIKLCSAILNSEVQLAICLATVAIGLICLYFYMKRKSKFEKQQLHNSRSAPLSHV